MVWVDYLIIVIVLLSAVISLFRGFVKEAVSLAFWVLAFIAAIGFNDTVVHWLPDSIESPAIRTVVAFVGLMVLILLIGGVVSFFAAQMTKELGLGKADRTMGALFGLLRGVALVLVMILVASLLGMRNAEFWQDSLLLPYLEPVAVWLVQFLPEDAAAYLTN